MITPNNVSAKITIIDDLEKNIRSSLYELKRISGCQVIDIISTEEFIDDIINKIMIEGKRCEQ